LTYGGCSTSWIQEHKTVWRVAILVLLLVAIMGPWGFFEPVNVPSDYPCSAPYIRLEGDMCGEPTPIIWMFYWFVSMPISMVVGLVTGATVLTDFGIEFVYILLICLLLLTLVLPFFSTLLLILRGDRTRQQVFNVAAWGLAAGIGLLFGLSRLPRLYWVLWGFWLYIGLAVSALVLELLVLVVGRRPSQGK